MRLVRFWAGCLSFSDVSGSLIECCICFFCFACSLPFTSLMTRPSFIVPTQIRFKRRKVDDIGNDCLMSVDGANCSTAKQGSSRKSFCSHKMHNWSSGLRCEIGVCVQAGNIAWINELFPPADWPDVSVFHKVLTDESEDGERVEADDGHRGDDSGKIKVPKSTTHSQDKESLDLRQDVRARHKTINNRIKNFDILNQKFIHDIEKHGDCHCACAVLTQLMFENGHPPHPVVGVDGEGFDDPK